MKDEKAWDVLENIEEGYYETDLRGNYHFCNAAYSKIIGVPKEDIIGSSYKKFLGEDAESSYRIFHTVFQTGNPFKTGSRKVNRPDGSQSDIEYSVSLIRDEKGQPIGFRGIVRDVTEKKQTEETLRQSEERYRTILENIEEGYYEVDLKGNFTFFNESFRNILGYTKEELLGGNYQHYADQETAQKGLMIYNQVYRTGEPVRRFEWTVTRKDGARRNLAVSVSLIKDAFNRPTGFRGIVRDETERKEAESALIKSEKKYRDIFENSVEGIYQATLEGRFLSVNPSLARINGYDSPEEMISSITDIGPQTYVVPKEREKLLAFLKENDIIEGFEFQSYRKDKNKIWISTNIRTVRDSEGRVLYLQGMCLDITKRKEAEEALRASEAKFRALVEHLPQRIFMKDLNSVYLTCNQNYSRDLGMEAEAIAGKTDFDLHPRELAEKYRADDRQVIGLGAIKIFEEKFYSLGKERWIGTTKAPYHDENGNIVGVIGIFEDITERKQAEDALKESEERFRLLFNQAADCILIMDPTVEDDPVIVEANMAAHTMHGYFPGELIGKPISLLDTPDNRKHISERTAILMSGQHLTGEAEHVRKDGATFQVEISSRMVQINGKPYIQTIERDLTERIRAQAEKAKLESQLRQAQKMEAIGTLAGGIAHDFNNILTIIIGCTELALADTSPDNPTYPHLMLVREAGARATDLVKQILAFSRQGDQEKRPIRPGVIVKEALKMLRSSLPSTIRIRQIIEEDLGLVMADPTQIHQILINLCTNAAHAMREKGDLLEVRLTNVQVDTGSSGQHPDLSPGPYVNLTVSDNGHGMEAEVMERVFDPYFTTKAVGEGAGLGLAVVYGIIKSHKGAVKVHSRPGKGSIFEVLLPRIEYSQQEIKTIKSEQTPGGNERILLVDDEEALVFAIQQILERLGYRVTARTSSLEALETLRTRPQEFDLLITDMTMPNMTGVELSKRIKQIRPELPMVLCTGFSEMIDEIKAKSMGFRAFVMKPIILQNIARTIRKVLDRKVGE